MTVKLVRSATVARRDRNALSIFLAAEPENIPGTAVSKAATRRPSNRGRAASHSATPVAGMAAPRRASAWARDAGLGSLPGGGAEIFRLALEEDRIDRLYLTRIHQEFEGDTWFPAYDEARFRLVRQEDHGVAEGHPYPFSFLDFERRR